MNLPVTTTPEADAQIRTIDDWWRENRRASRDLFLTYLAGAFEIIAGAPSPSGTVRAVSVRRFARKSRHRSNRR